MFRRADAHSRRPSSRSERAGLARTAALSIALWLGLVAAVGLLIAPAPARAGVPVTLYRSFAGNLDFVGTAGSLRVGNCGSTTSASGTLSGIPSSATIEAAYLYWAGSDTSVDTTITLATPAQSGLSISADRTFTETFNSGGTDYSFYSGFADVTSQVVAGRNGTYTLSGLTFQTGAPWSNVSVCLGGWSLIVVYEDAGEPLRVVNVFDGFENFRGSQITLTPDNFVIPSSPINGKLGHITWEGDVGNSSALNGFQEALSFEGSVLSDVDNPINTQFNSVSNVSTPTSFPPGVDFDVYSLASPELYAGQTFGTSVYSSGGDRVLLSAEIFSVTNTPVADLSILKDDGGADFLVGQNGTWTLTVSSAGPSDDPGPIQVMDTLPAGTSFVSATGAGWSCGEASGTVTCTNASGLSAGASLPPITLEVAVASAAMPSVDNTASVAGTLFDNVSGNNSVTISTDVLAVDLSTSTKGVADLNGIEPEPGDVLRYTISLIETNGSAASGVQVTDDMPPSVTGLSVVSLPAGATDVSTGSGTGGNGTGFLDIQNITVPASGSVDIVFDVTIAAGTSPGTVLSNSATIAVATGTGATPSAPDVIVSPSQVAASGSKQLYMSDPNGADARGLSRVAPNGLPPTGTLATVDITRGASDSWTLSEPLAASVALSGASFPVELYLRRSGGGTNARNRSVRVDVVSASLGAIASTTQTVALTPTPQLFSFTMLPGAVLPGTLPGGDVLTMNLSYVSGGGPNARVRVSPAIAGTGNSRVELNATTVVNVDSVDFFDALHPAGVTPVSFGPSETVTVRGVVSDPFGAFDISGATLEVFDPLGASAFGPAPMSEIAALQTASTKTFEAQYALGSSPLGGSWTARIVSAEGAEGTISDAALGNFEVANAPDLVIFKIVTVVEDPVNGTTNPKAIPSATVLYTLGISNQGAGSADADSLVIEDDLPVELELYVADLVTPGPIHFVDGSPPSGVSVGFVSLADDTDDLEFDDGSGLWALDPVADVDGFDSSVTAIRVRPAGTLSGSSGTPPSFELRFRARVR